MSIYFFIVSDIISYFQRECLIMSGNFNDVQIEDVDYHINHCNDNNKKSNEGGF